jgi:hypothetical protein
MVNDMVKRMLERAGKDLRRKRDRDEPGLIVLDGLVARYAPSSVEGSCIQIARLIALGQSEQLFILQPQRFIDGRRHASLSN